MNLREYWNKLNSHDWYYQYSDDHSVWTRGSQDEARLAQIAKESEEHRKLFDEFNKHIFSGPHYGTEKAPKPTKPAE